MKAEKEKSYYSYLKQLKPKPIFNLNYYKGDDNYSDGDVENQILQIIAENEPEDYTKAIIAGRCTII